MTDTSGPGADKTTNDDLLSDDNFHAPETDEWWEHETVWFWWFNAERKLGAWNYHYLRPNVGIAGGGLMVFDETAYSHMEVPYYFSYWNTPLPENPDFSDFTFVNGERFQTIDPLEHYRITYADNDADGIDLELERAYFPLAPGEDIEIQARVFVDENKIPPDNETLQRFLVGLHSFYATEDAFLPFGGISMDIRPRNGSEIVFTEVVDSQPERLDVRGELIGRTPQAQTIDAVLVDASGRVSQGTARTGSDGRFAIPIGDPAPGPAKLTLYYFGDKMSPSDLTVAVEVR